MWKGHYITITQRGELLVMREGHLPSHTDAPLYYMAAGAFTKAFRQAVEASGKPAILWSLADVYSEVE